MVLLAPKCDPHFDDEVLQFSHVWGLQNVQVWILPAGPLLPDTQSIFLP